MPTQRKANQYSVFNQGAMQETTVAEQNKILSTLEILTSSESNHAVGMIRYLNMILDMLNHPDLLDPNRFGMDSSKAKRLTWNPRMCNQISKGMPKEGHDLYVSVLRNDVENEQSISKNYTGNGREKYNVKMNDEVMNALARDALRGVIESELKIAEGVANLEARRDRNIIPMMRENYKRRTLCTCKNRCIESFYGACKTNGHPDSARFLRLFLMDGERFPDNWRHDPRGRPPGSSNASNLRSEKPTTESFKFKSNRNRKVQRPRKPDITITIKETDRQTLNKKEIGIAIILPISFR